MDELEKVSGEAAAAFEEAQTAFNFAKKHDVETVTLKRRSLYLILVLAAHAVGLEVQDASEQH